MMHACRTLRLAEALPEGAWFAALPAAHLMSPLPFGLSSLSREELEDATAWSHVSKSLEQSNEIKTASQELAVQSADL